MKWFRLWHEWGHDPKVISMPEHMQCRHIKLLCLRRQVDTSTLSDEEIAAYMRIDMDALNETKELFEKKGFIDNGWCVLAWDFRNPASDSGAERMRRYRERQKKKKSDVTVTPPLRHGDARDTDTETDKTYSAFFNALWKIYPRKQNKKAAVSKIKTLLKRDTSKEEILRAATNYKKATAGKENQFIQLASTFFGPNGAWEEWIEGPPEGFSGVHTGPPPEDPHKHLKCVRCQSWWSTMERNEEGICENCQREALSPS